MTAFILTISLFGGEFPIAWPAVPPPITVTWPAPIFESSEPQQHPPEAPRGVPPPQAAVGSECTSTGNT
jgi:hypothetical protein